MKRGTVGFTLIELVIIIVIVSIAIGTLLTTLAAVTRDTIRPLVMQIASELAEQEVDRVTTIRYSAVCPCTNNAYNHPGFSGYSRQINVNPIPAGLVPPGYSQVAADNFKMVDVIVTNNTIGSVTLRTIVTNRGPAPPLCPAAAPCTCGAPVCP